MAIAGGAFTAGDARRIADAWVRTHAAVQDGFIGAYTVGSINSLADEERIPQTSDVDVMVVLDAPEPPMKPGKMAVDGVLLEITYLALDDVRDPERVLAHYHLAPGVWSAHILADPDGHLHRLREVVRAEYARREWVERRCEMARDTVLQRLESIDLDAPLHQQAMSLLFAWGGVPHILLVAGLLNPTVRKRFEAARGLLESQEGDSRALYLALLGSLGAEKITPAQASRHVRTLEEVFDVASRLRRSPVPYASDLSAEARVLAIDGSREAIGRGDHREAMFWIAVTFTRCQQVLWTDAPETAGRWDEAYRALLADLGIGSAEDIQAAAGRVARTLPAVWEVAESLMPAR